MLCNTQYLVYDSIIKKKYNTYVDVLHDMNDHDDTVYIDRN